VSESWGDKLTQDDSWQELYRTAMLELDLTKLQDRIEGAVAAIRSRLDEAAKNQVGAGEEHQVMIDALQNLRTLQQVERRNAQSEGTVTV
jgi:hypothetical protein